MVLFSGPWIPIIQGGEERVLCWSQGCPSTVTLRSQHEYVFEGTILTGHCERP